jgi:ribosomal protein S18 acetylase RimI-like enzyme
MQTTPTTNSQLNSNPGGSDTIQPLNNEHKSEVLKFLSARPLQTFIMASWIRDNGMVSLFNRGNFYGYRDHQGQLQGVALVGHVTLFETKVDSALEAFADLTYKCSSARSVLGEAHRISQFVSSSVGVGRTAPRICRERLLEKGVAESLNLVQSLRPATSEHLDLVVPIHAQTAFEESGVNPLEVDPEGFRERCARRIQQGRVWVAIENGRLKFKADIISDTPDVVYLEGLYVSAEHRGNGYGARCLTQLTNHLLERTNSVCLMVNETNAAAQKSYQKAGYQFREHYDTLRLDPYRG